MLPKMRFCAKYVLFSVQTHLCRQKPKNFVVLLDNRNSHFGAFNHSRNIFMTNKLSAKSFSEGENAFAYKIIQTLPIIKTNLFQTIDTKSITSLDEFNQFLDQNWGCKSASEIVGAFKAVSEYCIQNNIDVSDKRFDKLVDGLMDRVLELTDSELSDLLVCLRKYPACLGFDSHNFHDIWSALDDVCCSRIPKWSNETKFLFADHWYHLNLGRIGDFSFYFVDHMIKKLKGLSKDELVYLTYLMGVSKRHQVLFEVQNEVDKHIHEMSIKEIALIADTYTKLKSKPKFQNTIEICINKLIDELPDLDEVYISEILDLLRYSTHTLFVDKLLDLLDHLVPEIDRLSNLCCVHIGLLGTTVQFLHKESLRKICQKLVHDINDVDKMRVKDMEKLLIPLLMFNYDPKTKPDIFDAIFKEVHLEQRRKEFITYPRCLSSILNLLSMRGLYSYELIDVVLNMDYVTENYGKNAKYVPRELFCLDVSVQVECPDYKGNRLDDAFLKKGIKWLSEYAPTKDQYKRLSKADLYFLSVVETVEKVVGGSSKVLVDHILGNFVKADIIVCMDEAGNFVQPDGFDKYTFGDILRPPNAKLKWFSIMPTNWNNEIKNTNEPLGIIHMRCRQLKALGYTPVLICWHDFQAPGVDKIQYVRNKLL